MPTTSGRPRVRDFTRPSYTSLASDPGLSSPSSIPARPEGRAYAPSSSHHLLPPTFSSYLLPPSSCPLSARARESTPTRRTTAPRTDKIHLSPRRGRVRLKNHADAQLIPLLIASLALPRRPSGRSHRAASVRGLVGDQSGLPVARGERACGARRYRRVASRDDRRGGRFALAELESGTYRFDVTLAGYGAYTRQAQLAVGQDLWLDVPLAVAVRQDVDVSAPFVPIDRDSPALGTLIDRASGHAACRSTAATFSSSRCWRRGRRRRRRDRRARCAATSPSPSTARARTSTPTCSTASTTSTRSSAPPGVRPPVDAHPRVRGRDVDLRRVVRPQRRAARSTWSRGPAPTASPAPPTSSSATARSTRATHFAPENEPAPDYNRQPVRRLDRRARSSATARSSSPTTRARGCAKAITRVTNVPTRGRAAAATSRSRCSARRSIRLPASRFPAAAFRPFAAQPDWPRDRGALSAAEPQRRRSPTSSRRPTRRRRRRSVRRAARPRVRRARRAGPRGYSFSDRRLFEPFAGAGFSLAARASATTSPARARTSPLAYTQPVGASLVNDVARRLQPRGDRRVRRRTRRSTTHRSGLPRCATNPRDAGPEPDLDRRLLAARATSTTTRRRARPTRSRSATRRPGRAARTSSSSAASGTACGSARIATCRRAAS